MNKCKLQVVIGGVNVDLTVKYSTVDQQQNGATYPGQVWQSFGGVGRNVTDCLTRLQAHPIFISAVGDDSHAQFLFDACQHMVI